MIRWAVVFVRWGVLHLNVEGWGGGSFPPARSRISVFERVWTNWDCLCSRGAAGSRWVCRRRRVSLTERALHLLQRATWSDTAIRRSGDRTSDLRFHISFIFFWETSRIIFISHQQSLVLEFHCCVHHLFFWVCRPALWVRYDTYMFREPDACVCCTPSYNLQKTLRGGVLY